MGDSLEEKFGAWELFEEIWEKTITEDTVNILDKVDIFIKDSPFHDRLNLRADVKDNVKARSLRARGNELFHPKVKRYIEAIKCYNESIAFSEKGTEDRAIAFANRSMICYELQRYEECLENIRLARDSNYPERLAGKLVKREEDARKALLAAANKHSAVKGSDNSQAHGGEVKLSYNAYETLPQVAECLELAESEKFGRFIVTNRQLNAGDVVILEQPFCRLLRDVYRCIRCDFCLKESIFTLIPCERCTVAMYCTAECMDKAYKQYHRVECPIIRNMWRIFTKLPVLSLRVVITAIYSFDYNLQAMEEHLGELDKKKVNAFTMDWTKATSRDVYDTVHVLETNANARDSKDRMLRVFFTTIISKLLMEHTDLGIICGLDFDLSGLLGNLILRHLQTSAVNMHSLHYMEYQPDQQLYELENHASACFPLLSMLNHSCAPNVTRVTLLDGRCAVIVNRPIPKGGQLYDNYGMHHSMMGRKERRYALAKQYRFNCQCEACINDYPLYHGLPSIDTTQHGMIDIQAIHAELLLHNVQLARELLPKLRRYLNDIGHQYPGNETCSCQELFLRSFQILHSPTSESAHYWKYCNP
ncbi:SET and MYND domain-containing protein 4 [Anopheles funestus]|uniref:SET and MYND domain-containing protein 4 n=1 Tax=Anopheles funestus TaxID=62324 RepID=UPI0020C65613|nr:SET and MYND domain-containing protein 4 [Anopheles funestus]XP_049295486.1 SET and MYND domain-containing protein 4 [Anopheles funestus]